MPDADEAALDAAVEGGFDFGALEVAGGLVKVCLGGGYVCLGFVELGDAQDEGGGFFLVADVFPVEACLFGACLLLDEGGLGAGEV